MTGAIRGSGAGSTPREQEWEDADDGAAQLSPLVVDAVGRALQRHFQAIAEMPLPDRLLVLLAELEARERAP
ncbi:MAG TPA: NepR family anti-sigma factor [Roseiarcus sp.]|nr:NepR family anti-sigma factor [Roseiarcus sp.]